MAIVKIGILQPLTPAEYDWDKLLGHVLAFNKQVNGLQFPVSGSVIKKSSYIQHGGVLYQVQTSDYTIQGSLTGGVFNYVKIEASGELLVATWITDISGYSWSNEYNCLLAGDESSLLALTERDGVLYRLEGKKVIASQELLTDSDVEFGTMASTTINTGQGNNKLYKETRSELSIVATAADSTLAIAEMSIGETRKVYAELTSSDSFTATLTLPTTTGSRYSLHAEDGSTQSESSTIASFQYTISSPATIKKAFIIWRIY